MPSVSVIIVNWNTKDLTDQAIGSFYAHEVNDDFEIIVIDNASMDGSAGFLSEKYPKIRIIRNSENLGFAKANNQGVAEAKGEFVLLFNSDAFLIRSILPETLSIMREKGPCILGCRLLNADRTLQLSTGEFPTLWSYFLESMSSHRRVAVGGLIRQANRVRRTQPVDWISGAFIMAPRKTYQDLGGLFEGIFMYGEDIDLCRKAAASGIPCLYTPAVEAVHLGGASIDHLSSRALLIIDQGRLAYWSRWNSRPSAMALRFIFILRSAYRVIGFSVAGSLPGKSSMRAKAKVHLIGLASLLGGRNAGSTV